LAGTVAQTLSQCFLAQKRVMLPSLKLYNLGGIMQPIKTTASNRNWPTKSFTRIPLAVCISSIFALTACDGSKQSVSAVNTTANTAVNAAPVAQTSGDITVRAGKLTQLDASQSTDSDGDSLSYTWKQSSGQVVELQNANTAKPTFTAPNNAGDLVFNVVVSDGQLSSPQASVTINILPTPPLNVSASGTKTVRHGNAASLKGAVSNVSSNDGLNYQWTQTGGIPVELSGANTATANFKAGNKSGFAFFKLDVTSNNGATGSNKIAVAITNTPPVAVAELNGNAAITGQTVKLSAEKSKDADGDKLSYSWKQVAGKTVELANANAATASFVAPSKSTFLAFEVQVNDGEFNSYPSTVLVTIDANSETDPSLAEAPAAPATATTAAAPATATTPAAATTTAPATATASPATTAEASTTATTPAATVASNPQ